jgi:UbiD family decarboxylase
MKNRGYQAAIRDAVSRVVARVHKVRLTPASGGWLHAIISIDKRHEGDAKNAMMAAFAAHPSLKQVIVVDSDIDPDNPSEVEWAIATRFQADEDLIIIRNVRGSTLDPSSRDGLTAKMGIDATKPLNAGIEYEKPKIP